MKSKIYDIGRICPDEILDLCFEVETQKTVLDSKEDNMSKRHGDSINHQASVDAPGTNDAKIFN